MSSLLGLDRKQMEAERLARLSKKRGADDLDPSSSIQEVPSKARKLSPTQPISPPPIARDKPKTEPRPISKPESKPTSEPDSSPNSILQYPHGTIKKTWCFKYPRTNEDIKLEEVLEKGTINIAVLSSWQIDFEWLHAKLLPTTKLYMIMQSKSAEEQARWRRDAEKNWSNSLRLCFPPMSGPRGVMHSKLMLLFHKEKLRVVIPSANLVPHDWGENGIMENVVFLVDLPRVEKDKAGDANETFTQFAKDLVRFLDAQGVDEDVKQGLKNFDFSKTGHLELVWNMPGTHVGKDAECSGLVTLAKGVERQRAGLEGEGEEMLLDFTISSVGSLNRQYLSSVLRAFEGRLLEWYAYASYDEDTIIDHMRIHYPSEESVDQSNFGRNGAGTLFFAPKFEDDLISQPLLRCMRDFKSQRKGVLSHAKMAIARTKDCALVYVGSANLSMAAWGKVTVKKSQKAKWARIERTISTNCSNWEIGVLMKIDGEQVNTLDTVEENRPRPADIEDRVVSLDVLRDKVPVPFQIPGLPYVDDSIRGNCKRPWIQKFS